MFSEDDLLPISALQHLLFCERQCALIHVEREWVENRLTAEGRILHERADGKRVGPRGGGREQVRYDSRGARVRIVKAVELRSVELGMFGVADVVEFRTDEAACGAGRIDAFPIEYKRGRPKANRCDEVQLCAQGLCLEEMLQVEVYEGALFYGRTRRRQRVVLDRELRRITEEAVRRLRELITSGQTPAAVREPKCRRCSLLNVCMPDAVERSGSVRRYVARVLAAPDA